MRIRISAWGALAIVIIITVVFFYSISSGTLAVHDVLYTDLIDFPAFVKTGFEPGYAGLTDPGLTDWELCLPAGHNSAVIMSRLPVDETSGGMFLSIGPRSIEDFTILIPFTMNREKIDRLYGDNPLAPGMYLAGIGENWEIYLNGEPVVRQRYVNDNNEITSFRSQRSVAIPFDKKLLNSGENILLIHITGERKSEYTGLFYNAPYYIGDYTKISGAGNSFLTVSLCTLYIFLGLYHILLFFLRKTDSYNLSFGVFSCLIAVYFCTRSPVIYQMSKNTAITQRVEFASLYLILLALSVFLENLNFGKIKPVSIVYGVFCTILIILQSLFSVWFACDLLLIWQAAGVVFLLYIVIYDIIYNFIKQVIKRRKAENPGSGISGFWFLFFRSMADRETGNVFLLMVISIFCGIFDILDAAVFRTGVMLSRYSFLALMLCMAFILARKYANRFESTAQLNELLEETVKQRTQELEEQVIIANSASRAKGEFLANMSHEIRTPLNAVIGMTAIGSQTADLSGKDYAFKKIKEASEHLLGIINDILDMSKIEAGKLELSEINFRVRDVVSRVENVMRFKTDEKHQEFIVNFSDDIPGALCGDDVRLAQVITNLVGNAVKFTPDGGRITLSLSLSDEANGICTLRFLVQDTGIGITDEQKVRLFQSFQQAESSTTRKYGGTGLGLALSRQIIELMGGWIWVDSVPGNGSTFGFTIKAPRVEMSTEDKGVDSTAEMVKGEFAGKVVLLADDVEINREIVIALLEPSGAIIETAENGEQAAAMFENSPEHYDVVLMDVQMPVMDGYDAAAQIRAGQSPQAAAVPIIAMTANVFREDIERSLASGMNAHLGKPVELDKLLSLLRKYLAGKAPL
ncbi:MAG: response regulator [Treponema sp.]|jgi:signal transduction histidine kinase|nr:response regulator [Treponema sp.]